MFKTEICKNTFFHINLSIAIFIWERRIGQIDIDATIQNIITVLFKRKLILLNRPSKIHIFFLEGHN